MTFYSFLKRLSFVLITLLTIGILIVGFMQGFSFLTFMLCFFAAFLICTGVYAAGYALEKLDYIHSNSKVIAQSSEKYLHHHEAENR